MNTASAGKKIAETATAETFKQKEYRLLIVANKFQTGFDQPLLQTMYVDKKFGGVNAVQTLSRLNRTHLDKVETLVLDFANEAEEIQKAFQPYYERTLLKKATDPNLLYDLLNRLTAFHLYTEAEVNKFAVIYFDPKGTQDKPHATVLTRRNISQPTACWTSSSMRHVPHCTTSGSGSSSPVRLTATIRASL